MQDARMEVKRRLLIGSSGQIPNTLLSLCIASTTSCPSSVSTSTGWTLKLSVTIISLSPSIGQVVIVLPPLPTLTGLVLNVAVVVIVLSGIESFVAYVRLREAFEKWSLRNRPQKALSAGAEAQIMASCISTSVHTKTSNPTQVRSRRRSVDRRASHTVRATPAPTTL